METDREISAATLAQYLPQDQGSKFPTLLKTFGGADSGLSERDLLYKILFDMRKDMTELKKLVFELITNGQVDASVLHTNQELFEDFHGETLRNVPTSAQTPSSIVIAQPNEPHTIHIDGIQDITHEEESLSLNDKEKEMILRALKKNKNKRRHAARDLGISERTLYRKLKEYDLENLE